MKLYEEITLTDEEIAAALLEGKKKKYFKEKNRAYWESQERPVNRRGLPHDKAAPLITPAHTKVSDV